MIIPLHLIPEQNAPYFTFDGHAVDASLRPQASASFDLASPIVGPVAGAELQRFQALMNREGMDLEPTRMVYDRAYAFERLAAGFGASNMALRELAVNLFADYQQAGEFIGLTH